MKRYYLRRHGTAYNQWEVALQTSTGDGMWTDSKVFEDIFPTRDEASNFADSFGDYPIMFDIDPYIDREEYRQYLNHDRKYDEVDIYEKLFPQEGETING